MIDCNFVVAVIFFCGAMFHAMMIWNDIEKKEILDCQKMRRHLAFVCINFTLGLLVLFQVWWTFIPMTLLLIQQWDSHGRDIYEKFRSEREVDWSSVITIIALTVSWKILIRQKNKTFFQKKQIKDFCSFFEFINFICLAYGFVLCRCNQSPSLSDLRT